VNESNLAIDANHIVNNSVRSSSVNCGHCSLSVNVAVVVEIFPLFVCVAPPPLFSVVVYYTFVYKTRWKLLRVVHSTTQFLMVCVSFGFMF